MAGQGYKRTNFEEEDYASNGGTPPPIDFPPSSVGFRGGVSIPTWKQRTIQEKVLLVLVAVLTLVVVIMAGVMAMKDSTIKVLEKETQKYCVTPECVKTASTLLTAMDLSVDPCEDFYQYACGGWMKNNPIPSGYSRWGTFEVMWQKNTLVMKNAIDKPDSEFKSSAELKAKRFYQSCMDDDKIIEQAGARPLLDLLYGLGWSINISRWDHTWELPDDWQLGKVLEDAHLLGIPALFAIWVGEDDKNSSANVIQADQAGIGLPNRDYYLNKTIDDDKVLSAYRKYMVKLFTLLGAPNDTYTFEQATKIIEFEADLANITIAEEERRDQEKNYHAYTLGNMSKSFPVINWYHLANHLLQIVDIKVQPSEKVVVYAPEFLEQLNTMIEGLLSTKEGKKLLQSYLLWHVVKDFAGLLSKDFREAEKEFSDTLSGVSGNDDLWHMCISSTDSVLGFAIGAMFVKDSFQGSSKEKAKVMIENVRNAFKSNLPNLDWMDPETQAAALDKANAVNDMIGYPDYIMDQQKLDDKYKGFEVNASDYFGNNIRALNFGMKKALEKLRKVPKNEWVMTPPTVNAYYTPSKNSIVFPAGILQAPFFDKSFPQSLNYGAMGVVMGHELTHGFDDQGREFDKYGNLRAWWKKDAIDRFNEKTKCMIDQYSDYKLNEEHERGKQTLGENIADNGGLKSSYHAYLKWVKENGEEQLLPAIGLSHKQLFFLSFAQVWCWNSKPESDHMQILTDPHSPAKFRVIGPLSNSYDFAKEYKCSPKSRMNPAKKCDVW